MKHRVNQLIATAALAVTAVFAVCAPAQAAAVRTVWDPEFGEPLVGIGWEGSMLWDDVTGVVKSLSVSFYEWNEDDPSNTTAVIPIKTPLFTANALTGFVIDDINKVDGKVVSYSSSMWTQWQLAEPEDKVDSKSPLKQAWEFSLQFQLVEDRTFAQLATRPKNSANDSAIKFSNELARVYCDQLRFGDPTGLNATCGMGLTPDSSPVPEPGTMALVVAALMGVGVVGRRRLKSAAR